MSYETDNLKKMIKKEKYKKIFLNAVPVLIIACLFLFLFNTESCSRTRKNISSDFGGGIERTVTLYDFYGNEIRSWNGKFDIKESENKVLFDDQNGKRVVIYNGVVVSEEK